MAEVARFLVHGVSRSAHWPADALLVEATAAQVHEWAQIATGSGAGDLDVFRAHGHRLPPGDARRVLADRFGDLPAAHYEPAPPAWLTAEHLAVAPVPDAIKDADWTPTTVRLRVFPGRVEVSFKGPSPGTRTRMGPLGRTQLLLLAPTLAADAAGLGAALGRLGEVSPDLLADVLAGYRGDLLRTLPLASPGFHLRATWPDGLPQAAVQALLEHADGAVRELGLLAVGDTPSGRAHRVG